MAAQDIVDAAVIRGGGAGLWRPATPASSGEVTGVGTDVPFLALQDTEITIVIDGNAAAQEFISILLDHGVEIEFIKLNKKVSGATGALKESGTGSGSGDQISATVVETDLTMMQNILSMRGTRGRITVPLGEAAGSVNANTGWASLFGTLSANVTRKTQGETVVTVSLQFTGQEFAADTAGDTAIAAAGAAMTPLEGTELTPPIITDLVTLKKGQLVLQ